MRLIDIEPYEKNGDCEIRFNYNSNRTICRLKRSQEIATNDYGQNKGEWIVIDECGKEGIYCSKCNKRIYDFDKKPQKTLLNFCSHCGADMRDKIEDPNKKAITELSNLLIAADDDFINKSEAIEVAISALEKQIPKKIFYRLNGEDYFDKYCHCFCPNCEADETYITYDTINGHAHCTKCGQALDWNTEDWRGENK